MRQFHPQVEIIGQSLHCPGLGPTGSAFLADTTRQEWCAVYSPERSQPLWRLLCGFDTCNSLCVLQTQVTLGHEGSWPECESYWIEQRSYASMFWFGAPFLPTLCSGASLADAWFLCVQPLVLPWKMRLGTV
jgi:hypothetical protein